MTVVEATCLVDIGKPMRFLMPLLLALPFMELWLLIHIGSSIGALTTIALLILAGMAGSAVLRWQGVSMLWKVQERLQRGDMAADAVFDGLLMAAAGLLLFIPGFISDSIALLLLIPPLRHWIARTVLLPHFMQDGFIQTGEFVQTRGGTIKGEIIEGEFQREQETDHKLP